MPESRGYRGFKEEAQAFAKDRTLLPKYKDQYLMLKEIFHVDRDTVRDLKRRKVFHGMKVEELFDLMMSHITAFGRDKAIMFMSYKAFDLRPWLENVSPRISDLLESTEGLTTRYILDFMVRCPTVIQCPREKFTILMSCLERMIESGIERGQFLYGYPEYFMLNAEGVKTYAEKNRLGQSIGSKRFENFFLELSECAGFSEDIVRTKETNVHASVPTAPSPSHDEHPSPQSSDRTQKAASSETDRTQREAAAPTQPNAVKSDEELRATAKRLEQIQIAAAARKAIDRSLSRFTERTRSVKAPVATSAQAAAPLPATSFAKQDEGDRIQKQRVDAAEAAKTGNGQKESRTESKPANSGQRVQKTIYTNAEAYAELVKIYNRLEIDSKVRNQIISWLIQRRKTAIKVLIDIQRFEHGSWTDAELKILLSTRHPCLFFGFDHTQKLCLRLMTFAQAKTNSAPSDAHSIHAFLLRNPHIASMTIDDLEKKLRAAVGFNGTIEHMGNVVFDAPEVLRLQLDHIGRRRNALDRLNRDYANNPKLLLLHPDEMK